MEKWATSDSWIWIVTLTGLMLVITVVGLLLFATISCG